MDHNATSCTVVQLTKGCGLNANVISGHFENFISPMPPTGGNKTQCEQLVAGIDRPRYDDGKNVRCIVNRGNEVKGIRWLFGETNKPF